MASAEKGLNDLISQVSRATPPLNIYFALLRQYLLAKGYIKTASTFKAELVEVAEIGRSDTDSNSNSYDSVHVRYCS